MKLLKPYLVARHHELCDLSPPKIRRSVTVFVVSNDSKQRIASIFKGQPLKMKALCFFKWRGAACQRHVVSSLSTIPEFSDTLLRPPRNSPAFTATGYPSLTDRMSLMRSDFRLCEGISSSVLPDSVLVSKAFLRIYTSVPSLKNEQLQMLVDE